MIAGVCLVRFPADDFVLEYAFLFEAAATGSLLFVIARSNPWLAAFFGLAFCSRMYPVFDPYSDLAFYSVLFAGGWYVFVTERLNVERIQIIYNFICFAAILSVVYQIIQATGHDFIFLHYSNRERNVLPVGFLGNGNVQGSFLALCLPAFFRVNNSGLNLILRYFWTGLIPLVFYGIYLSGSMGAFVASFAGCYFFVAIRGKKAAFLWTGVMIALLLINHHFKIVHDEGMIDHRIDAWLCSIMAYKQRWIQGYGLGHWKVIWAILPLGKTWWSTAHNEIYQGGFEMGAAFYVIYAGYVVGFFRKINRTTVLPATAILVLLVNSLVHFVFHIGVTALIAVFWMAIFDLEAKNEKKRKMEIEKVSTGDSGRGKFLEFFKRFAFRAEPGADSGDSHNTALSSAGTVE
jgi:hypothetical protein